MGMLGRLRKNFTVGAANTLYKSLKVPIFDYFDSVKFGPAVRSATQTV